MDLHLSGIKRATMGVPRTAYALYECRGEDVSELSFKKGDIIENSEFNCYFKAFRDVCMGCLRACIETI